MLAYFGMVTFKHDKLSKYDYRKHLPNEVVTCQP